VFSRRACVDGERGRSGERQTLAAASTAALRVARKSAAAGPSRRKTSQRALEKAHKSQRAA